MGNQYGGCCGSAEAISLIPCTSLLARLTVGAQNFRTRAAKPFSEIKTRLRGSSDQTTPLLEKQKFFIPKIPMDKKVAL